MGFLLAILVAAITAPIARFGLRLASEGKNDIANRELFVVALLGAAICAFVSPWPIGSVGFCALLSLGALLPVGGWIDRKTAWAPDLIMGPIVVASLVLGGSLGAWSWPWWAMALSGAVIYGASQAVWVLCAMRFPDFDVPPPADLFALGIPFMLFGIHPAFVVTTLAISAILLLCKVFPVVNSLFSRREVVEDVWNEFAKSGIKEQSAITFLALAFPVTLIVLLATIFID